MSGRRPLVDQRAILDKCVCVFAYASAVGSDRGFLHQRHGSPSFAPLSPSDREWLGSINRMDVDLYRVARQMHALDVTSLSRLAQHASEENARRFEVAQSRPPGECCGFACQPPSAQAPSSNTGDG